MQQDETIYNGDIVHLTFETLISFPDKALAPENNNNIQYDQTKVTPLEFERILKSLYKNNYMLINIDEIYLEENDKFSQKQLKLRPDKKPIILSFNNVTYESSYQNMGSIDKIIIDRNNQFATYTTKKSIQDRIMHDNEFIPILESFINKHPDFSHHNARGIIFFTGEHGILGYETNQKNSTAKHEAKRVSEVISKLKSSGWKFGCNNYKYQHEDSITEIEFIKQLSLWKKEIEPLIGQTQLYAPPYGIASNDESKTRILLENGFNILFTNSTNCSIEFSETSILMNRIPINGNTLRNNKHELSHLFNCEEIYDHTNRNIPYEQQLL